MKALARLPSFPLSRPDFPSLRRPPASYRTRRPPFFSTLGRRFEKHAGQPADDPNFRSILDNPPTLVRAGHHRNRLGLLLLATIPLTAFALGTWQVQRLRWKTDLIARCEDRLVRPPLPLPPRVDADAVADDFDYRRVYCSGTFRHDQEMLIGPRMRDGQVGYLVVTPLERTGHGTDLGRASMTGASTVLVNRGWIPKRLRDQRTRGRESLPEGDVMVEGLLRKPLKKNMFTPENRPDKGEFYFPDVEQMAALTGSQPVCIEATMEPNYMQLMEFEERGIPIGRPAEVNLRNNHAQYIFTWYSLFVATTVMLYMVARKPPSNITRRVRLNKHW